MIALTGSEKQITWAEKIRTQKLTEIAADRAAFEALGRRKGASEDRIAAELAQFDAFASKVAARSEAAYWIDNRNSIARDLLKAAR